MSDLPVAASAKIVIDHGIDARLDHFTRNLASVPVVALRFGVRVCQTYADSICSFNEQLIYNVLDSKGIQEYRKAR